MATLSFETHEAGTMVSGFGSGWGSLSSPTPAPGTVTAPTLDPGTTDLAGPTTGGLTPGSVDSPTHAAGGSCCSACAKAASGAPGAPGAPGASSVSALSSGAPVSTTDAGMIPADLLDFAKRNWWLLLLLLLLLRRDR